MIVGDFAKARELNATLDRLHKDLFLDPSPSPAKYALTLLGRMTEHVRLPMTPCREETKAKVRSAMIRAGIDI
jgi:4-hydroxy-tetrahydrodipicolinate synthase